MVIEGMRIDEVDLDLEAVYGRSVPETISEVPQHLRVVGEG